LKPNMASRRRRCRQSRGDAMSQRKNLTLIDLPLFATDHQIGEAILGWARRKEFHGLATLREIDGMPKISTFWGGRYVPAVKAFLDVDQGLPRSARPLKENGVEGNFQGPRPRRRPVLEAAKARLAARRPE
jgi:hypothetical protein